MKKIIISLFLFSIIILSIGCEKEKSISMDNLNDVNNQIIGYFQQENNNDEYKNYCYNYVDEENKLVVVGLIENTKEYQEWFRKNVVDSNYLKFEQASYHRNH